MAPFDSGVLNEPLLTIYASEHRQKRRYCLTLSGTVNQTVLELLILLAAAVFNQRRLRERGQLNKRILK